MQTPLPDVTRVTRLAAEIGAVLLEHGHRPGAQKPELMLEILNALALCAGMALAGAKNDPALRAFFQRNFDEAASNYTALYTPPAT